MKQKECLKMRKQMLCITKAKLSKEHFSNGLGEPVNNKQKREDKKKREKTKHTIR